MLSHYVILLYPSISLVFILLSLHGARLFCGFFCGARPFLGSNALPISLNILSYPFTQQREKKLHTFGLEPSISCILTSGLNHYATILDITALLFVGICYRPRHRSRYPAAAAPTTGAGAAAATGPEPASLLARRRHRYPTPSSPPPTSFPSPLSRRRRCRYPAAAPATTGAGAAAATGPEPAVDAPGGGEIKTQWLTLMLSRTGKGGSYQAARHDEPDQPGLNNQQDKCQDIDGYKGINSRIKKQDMHG